jgi:cephalosporin hydroxylase
MDHGRVIGVDIEIRPHNRAAITAHPLSNNITLIEGSSTSPAVLERVRELVQPGEKVLVILDSNHTRDHVRAELEAYAPLVSVGSYIVATDGLMADIAGAPGTQPGWSWNNPKQAACEFSSTTDDYVIEEPSFPFNEGRITQRVTHWPSAFLRRVA